MARFGMGSSLSPRTKKDQGLTLGGRSRAGKLPLVKGSTLSQQTQSNSAQSNPKQKLWLASNFRGEV